jgi:hypothetical protein
LAGSATVSLVNTLLEVGNNRQPLTLHQALHAAGVLLSGCFAT